MLVKTSLKRCQKFKSFVYGEGGIPDCGLNSFRSVSTGQIITERVMRLDRNTLDDLRDVEIVCRTSTP